MRTLVFLAILFAIFQTNVDAQLLAVSGQKTVNSTNNQEVVLNAMNMGNWMVLEGYMMNSASQAGSQHVWKQKLTTLMGSANTKTFFDAWLINHVTEADINQVKAWGFNSVRLPIHYEYFVNSGTPDVWDNQGFTILDNVISWCKNAGVYAVIDLHAAPGGQSNNDISDYDKTKPSLWESEANKTKTVKLWRKLSERYKNEAWVAGYDLINEPAWNLPNGTALRTLYGRLTDTIRSNNDNHILFIEGNWYSNDYTGLTPAWDANMVYVFHKYWSANTKADIQWVLSLRTVQNRPIWCGEHGENSNHLFTELSELLNTNNIGMSWWPMKKFVSINDFADAKYAPGYNDVLNYLSGTNPGLNPTTAFNTMMQMAENVKLANCILNDEVVRSIFTQPGNRDTEPYSTNNIPGRIYTPDYDQGMNGYAYSDQAWADYHLTSGTYTSWNNGWVYRNNGVDIEATSDPLSNGYTVGWFNGGEWMKYTCNVALPGTYDVAFRVSNGNSTNGMIEIQNADGTEILGAADVFPTGGWGTWQTVYATCSFRSDGIQGFRIVNKSGEFNVNSVNFEYYDALIPDVVPVIKTANIIYLKGNNGKYVIPTGINNILTCTAASYGSTGKYTLVDAGNGQVALRGSNGLYVTLNSTDNKLYCNSATIGNYQKFTLTDLCGVYSIKGFNNLYASSEDGAASGMTCARTTPSGWEFFNWGITGFEIMTAVNESKAAGYKVFPNPAQNSIQIAQVLKSPATVIIYDCNGRSLLTSIVSSGQQSIDIQAIPDGIYVIKVIGLQKTEVIKFIKSN